MARNFPEITLSESEIQLLQIFQFKPSPDGKLQNLFKET